MMSWHAQRGSSLLEMMVVVSIIILLANIGVTMTVNARTKARDTIRVNDIKTVERALVIYYNDHGSYPTTPADLDNPDANFVWSGTCAVAACHGSWGRPRPIGWRDWSRSTFLTSRLIRPKTIATAVTSIAPMAWIIRF
ncbi:MAG: hypothetical protein AAB817_00225 [Patescibacteria group bacterium]